MSEIVGCQTGVPGDSSQHSRANFRIVVEGEDDVGAVSLGKP